MLWRLSSLMYDDAAVKGWLLRLLYGDPVAEEIVSNIQVQLFGPLFYLTDDGD